MVPIVLIWFLKHKHEMKLWLWCNIGSLHGWSMMGPGDRMTSRIIISQLLFYSIYHRSYNWNCEPHKPVIKYRHMYHNTQYSFLGWLAEHIIDLLSDVKITFVGFISCLDLGYTKSTNTIYQHQTLHQQIGIITYILHIFIMFFFLETFVYLYLYNI